ncbi:MAG: orotidine-5'-phosphate decarboxylase [Syntrophaceae bacterium]|nr:orotidine-5'-phosphate decarboxylase [Syntrophaceae bacterium]
MPSRNSDPRDKLIFALDVGEDMEEALSWVNRLAGHVGLFKIGKEAFTHFGPEIVRQVQNRGGDIFLDLKFHDIPNTVARAAEAAVGLGVAMFNIHASGGRKMMEEAVAATRSLVEKKRLTMPAILAVTILTSLNDQDLKEIGFRGTTREAVLDLARMAQDAGVSGVVASPQDIDELRAACGQDFLIVTPGIRGTGAAPDDQKRTLSPREAIVLGADYLVVGRPIRLAADPAAEADAIVGEIAQGMNKTIQP